MYRRGTDAYAHCLDFQYNNFGLLYNKCWIDVFSFVKKQPSLVNFCIHHCGKHFFFQCSTNLVGMQLCRHVPNSPKDQNKMMHHPCLLEKVVFLASKTFLSPIGTREKNKKSSTLNFMILQMVRNECEIWQTCRQTS